MLAVMSLGLIVAIALTVGIILFRLATRRRKGIVGSADVTADLNLWIRDVVEDELAAKFVGRHATAEERRPLHATFNGAPEPDVVQKVEDTVRSVEVEYVRYAHEKDAEVAVHIHYEDAPTSATRKRITWQEVPASVRTEIEARGTTRAFRTWHMPWTRP
jgi:hypothetical protein